jgi:hypothetical protein
MKTEITDETPIASVNDLAALLSENYGEINTIDDLARVLARLVGKPMKDVQVVIGIRPEAGERTLPNIACGSDQCRIILTKANGIRHTLHFPSTVGSIDAQMDTLLKAKTDEEKAFEKFQDDLLGTLDGYGHMSWTVGNEDWRACADAAVGLFGGKVYVATHVVVDCESGGWIDTIHKGVLPVEGEPPRGILSSFLDSCCEQYADQQDDESCQIDLDQCQQAIDAFDAHVARLWQIKPDAPESTFDLVFDDEQEEPFDPVAMGWVGADGRP